MKQDPTEILSSLLDAEPVDAAALGACLADPANQALLSDLALLRAAMSADDARPSAAFDRRMQATLKTSARLPSRWAGWAAAAVVTVGVGLALVFGMRDRPQDRRVDLPPTPDRVLSFSEHGSWS